MSRNIKHTLFTLSLIGTLSSLAVILFFSLFSGLTGAWEAKTLDYRFLLRGDTPSDSGIVLIDCDDRSMKSLGRWPWPRSLHANMIDILSKSGAKNIAYDIIFSQPSDKSEDDLLTSSVKRAGNVIFPVGLELSSEAPDYALKAIEEGTGVTPLTIINRSAHSLLSATRAVAPLKEMVRHSYGTGHISANRDPDGIIRRVPLVVDVAGEGYPAFALVAVAAYLDLKIENISALPGYISIKDKTSSREEFVETKIPVNDRGMMLINYAGKWGDAFTHYSFAEILETSKTQEGAERLKKRFSGKLCLITNTATGFDIKTTPLEKDYPGGGIHANIINTLLLKNFIAESGQGLMLAIVIFMGLASGAIAVTGNRLTGILNLFLLVTGYLALTFFFFKHFGVSLPVLPPVATVLLCTILSSLYLLKVAQKRVGTLLEEKEELSREFDSVNGQLQNKEAQINLLKVDLNELREQVVEDNRQEDQRKGQISRLESRIQDIGEERDLLKSKKELLDKRLSDLRVMEPKNLSMDNEELNYLKQECASFGIITANKKLLEAFRLLKKAAAARSPVLILGEAGTGKELFAKAVHKLSQRKERKMITVNLPAITETLMESELFGHRKGSFTGATENKTGKFEQADGGSIFLDEIGEMKLELQSKLLRVLQAGEIDPVGGKTKKVDIRVIAATNKELRKEVERGGFRLDLFSRLNVITITLPPLSERPEDVELLTHFYIQYFNQVNGRSITGVSQKAMETLKKYNWKTGNIRELRNTIDRGTIFAEGEIITEKDLTLSVEPEREPVTGQPVREEESADVSGDGAFLQLMRQRGFEINRVASELSQSRGTVAARFKGICFHFLLKEDLDISRASDRVAAGGEKSDFIERKIAGYFKNLLSICDSFSDKQEALKECGKRFKNIPQTYHPALEEIIRRQFEN